MRELIIATENPGKVKEIKELLSDLDLKIISKAEAGLEHIEIIEDGDTLKLNSFIKANAIADGKNLVLADDSGIFVDYLDEEPGLHSARYDENNDGNKKIIEALEGVHEDMRTASFRVVLTLIDGPNIHFIKGRVDGKIAYEERGDNGFGYDPIFIPMGYDETFGELSDDIKNEISHRALALKELKGFMKRVIL